MNKPLYFISTGAQNCFYTLRYKWTEVCGARTVVRDYFIKNLSTDRDEAIAKAKEYLATSTIQRDFSANFEVDAIVRRDEIDWSVFQAGKYAGQSIVDVVAQDKPYIVWVCENLGDKKGYAKTVELAKAYVAQELEDNNSARAAENKEREDAQKAKEAAAAASQYIGVVGARINFTGVVVFTKTFERQSFRGYGTENGRITVVDVGGNLVKYWGYLGEKGETVTFKATVKNHEIYNGTFGSTRQTTVSRPKVLSVSSAAESSELPLAA